MFIKLGSSQEIVLGLLALNIIEILVFEKISSLQSHQNKNVYTVFVVIKD